MKLLHPHLYGVDASGTPKLHGIHCHACELTSFPPQHFGCEKCGAHSDSIDTVNIAPTGTVVSSARVDHAPGTAVAVPFRIAEVRLDSGTKTRVTLMSPDPIAAGTRVEGVMMPVPADDAPVAANDESSTATDSRSPAAIDDSETIHELRFAPVRTKVHGAHDSAAPTPSKDS